MMKLVVIPMIKNKVTNSQFLIMGMSCLALIGCSSDPEVNRYEKKAMNEEVKSMESFRTNYHEFAEEMERSEASEEKAREIELSK